MPQSHAPPLLPIPSTQRTGPGDFLVGVRWWARSLLPLQHQQHQQRARGPSALGVRPAQRDERAQEGLKWLQLENWSITMIDCQEVFT